MFEFFRALFAFPLWKDIRYEKAWRNDFMSHGAYVFLAVWTTILAFKLAGYPVGFISFFSGLLGLLYTIGREVYDQIVNKAWCPRDFLAGILATAYAIIIYINLT